MRAGLAPLRSVLALGLLFGLGLGGAACGMSDAGETPDGPPMDAPPPCSAFLTFDPPMPEASASTVVRATAVVQAPGVLEYAWAVGFEGSPVAFAPAQADGSAITFPAVQAGVYDVQLTVSAVVACPIEPVHLNVRAPGANSAPFRVRVTPPASAGVPPFEKTVTVLGGADFTLGTLSLDPGVTASGTVQSGGAGVAAYLRLMPAAAKEAAVEELANASGSFTARLLAQPHDVLAIPTVPGHAARLVEDWTPSSPTIDLDAAAAAATVTGVVRGPGGAPLAGAKVQLKVGGVPSTVATTSATGAFSLLVTTGPGPVAVDVTPPDGSGLPRLLAQAAAFALDQSFQISYAALALRDLAGATIRRQGAPIAGAKVVLVGSLAGIGTVTAGATASASGVVRIAATASGAGVLPATLAPARSLSAVVEAAPNDHAVAAVDLTSGAPATIDAPPAAAIATELRGADDLAPIAGAVLDAVPAGALALAGVTSTIRARSGPGGQLSASLAAGGRYDLRIHDPVLARGAPRLVPDATAQTIAASYALRPALTATGKLLLQGSPTPVGGAAVQLLCSQCTGLERDRPLAEATSDATGAFTLVVPDPGTN